MQATTFFVWAHESLPTLWTFLESPSPHARGLLSSVASLTVGRSALGHWYVDFWNVMWEIQVLEEARYTNILHEETYDNFEIVNTIESGSDSFISNLPLPFRHLFVSDWSFATSGSSYHGS